MYVYFPLRKAGLSPKFTSYMYCRGPYEILDKLTDITCSVNWGQRGRPQVLHVDGLDLKLNQILQNEQEIQQESSAEDLDVNICLFGLRVPLENFSLIWRRLYYR